MKIMGIDPGLSGAFVQLEGNKVISKVMPTKGTSKDRDIDIDGVLAILRELKPDHVFIERITAFAMGAKASFTFGRGVAVLEMALKFTQTPFTLVEPAKWGKEMHEGIDGDLKPKAKSKKAISRLFPTLFPEGHKHHEGVVDAVLIAEYGRRKLGRNETN